MRARNQFGSGLAVSLWLTSRFHLVCDRLLHHRRMNRSSSMTRTDRSPLPNTPATARIRARSNNRYGAVLSSLHSFWIARAAAIASSNAARRDAYSVVLFDGGVESPIVNDFASTPDQLLDALLGFGRGRGTNFGLAIQQTQAVMEQNWNTER